MVSVYEKRGAKGVNKGWRGLAPRSWATLAHSSILLISRWCSPWRAKEVTFLLVGAGREWEKVRARVEQEGLTNVLLPGPAPHSHIFQYLADMDICLIPFRRTSVSDASCPLKFFEYAGACKPIISTPIREVRRIGKDFVTFVEDARELRDAIVDLLHAPQKRAFLAERGHATVHQRYNWGALTDEFIALVRAARGGLRHWETMQDSAALWPSQ
jgi:glycosyltransferase involved in cell wall biosynthesis